MTGSWAKVKLGAMQLASRVLMGLSCVNPKLQNSSPKVVWRMIIEPCEGILKPKVEKIPINFNQTATKGVEDLRV